MRHLLAGFAIVGVCVASTGCRSANARLVSAIAPDPHVAELHVGSRVNRLWKRQAECRVVAEYAGYRGEAGVVMSEGGPQPEEVTSVIDLWSPSPDAPTEHVKVTFFLRDRVMHSAHFPPPFDPRALAMPARPAEQRHEDLMQQPAARPANPLATGGEDTRRTDLRQGRPAGGAAPATGGQTQQTDLLRQGAQQQRTPCPVCEEPRGDISPCPHCGID
jgi:hypothetical protein